MRVIDQTAGITKLLIDQEELRAIRSSLVEALEVVDDHVLESRMRVGEAGVRKLMEELKVAYQRAGNRNLVSLDERELGTIRSALVASLELEDWEFPIRMGFTKLEVRNVLAEVSDLVSG